MITFIWIIILDESIEHKIEIVVLHADTDQKKVPITFLSIYIPEVINWKLFIIITRLLQKLSQKD
jgi:hypothetical protein